MIRTKILPCELNKSEADALNLASGQIYTKVLVNHWRILRKKNLWLSEKSGTRISDYQTDASLHAHTIDAAQQGFYKACKTAKALKKIDPNAKYPHWAKKFRTTTWKNTAIKRNGNTITLSNGRGNNPITIRLTDDLVRAQSARLYSAGD